MAEPEEPATTTGPPRAATAGRDREPPPQELPPQEVNVDDRSAGASVEVQQERPEPSASIATAVDPEGWLEAPPEPEPRVKPLSRPPAPGELPERRVVVIDEATDLDVEAGREEPAPSTDVDRGAPTDIGGTLDSEKAPKRRWRLFRKGE